MQSSKNPEIRSWVIPLLLLTTLFQNYNDILAVMNGESLKLVTYQGPIYFKIMKDFTYFIIISVIIFDSFKNRINILSPPSVIIILITVGMTILSYIENSLLDAAIGIRWFIPLFIFLIAGQWIFRMPLGGVSFWIWGGLGLNIGAQIYQMLFMPPVYGVNIFGLSARSPGLFIAPNSGAFLSCALAALVTVIPGERKRDAVIASALALFSSGLAQSGTGLVVALALLLRSLLGRSQVVFWSAGLMALTYAALNLDALTMREGFMRESGGGRVAILMRVFEESFASMTGFGLYTNASVLANEFGSHKGIADSLFASWLGNYGLMALPVTFFLAIFCLKSLRPLAAEYAFAPLATFVLFAGTTIVFEAYPMNMILVIALWLAVRKSRTGGNIYVQ